MSSRKITLLSLIGILLIVYILQITFDSKGKIKEVKPDTPITKIEIQTEGKENIILEKQNGDWILNSGHPANNDIADYILASLDDIKIIDTVSKTSNEKDLQQYGFNKNSGTALHPVNVTGYSAEGQIVQKITVGKTSTTGNQTYIKFDGKKEIYLVSGNLIIPFTLGEKDILDFTLYSIKTNEVYKIEKYNGERTEGNLEFLFEKTGEVAEAEWNSSVPVDGSKIENWLRSVEILSADQWIEEFDSFNPSDKPDLTYVISAAGKDIEIRFFGINEESGNVICMCSENKYFPCIITKETAEKYLKSAEDFK